jgi:CheY-like chemotaxis protein
MLDNQPVVLYVEDDPVSRKLMSMLLEKRMGLSHVTILENSENFIERMEALDPKPDVILLDIHMKPYNGFEMLRLLREFDWSRQTPVVALTASVMNEEVQQLKTAGFNGCLAKPIDLDSFPRTLQHILQGEIIWRITG